MRLWRRSERPAQRLVHATGGLFIAELIRRSIGAPAIALTSHGWDNSMAEKD